MRGILSYGAYLPYRRLERSAIAEVAGTGGGKGTRTVAAYDEDTTTLGVEAARRALRVTAATRPRALWFATVAPAYVDKTNATAIHAALRLDPEAIAADFGCAVRSGVAALRIALGSVGSEGPALVVAADIRTGLPGSADEANGGDGASALLIGTDADGPVLAEYIGGASATAEFLDRWRTPGSSRSRQWEEKFGEARYVPLGEQAWFDALKVAGLAPDQVDRVVVTSTHARAAARLAKRLGVGGRLVDDLAGAVGHTGAAHPGLLLGHALDTAEAGRVVALVSLADGADVLLFRTTDALAAHRISAAERGIRNVEEQAAVGGNLPYGKFLSWRGMLDVEPPRRPEPARPSASASGRNDAWKFAFVGSRDRSTGAIHLPPARVSMVGGAVDDMEPVPMADVPGTIVTFTVDKLAYSQSPPVVFAVVDFDGGGRLPTELTDVDATEVAIGARVEMTFRRLYTADGIHNYFWKARLIRG